MTNERFLVSTSMIDVHICTCVLYLISIIYLSTDVCFGMIYIWTFIWILIIGLIF